MKAHPPRVRLTGAAGAAGALAVSLPVLFGFGIPLLVFGQLCVAPARPVCSSPTLGDAFLNSVMTAGVTALLTVALALFLHQRGAAVALARRSRATVRLASVGYALPGGILGLGLLFALARFDNARRCVLARR